MTIDELNKGLSLVDNGIGITDSGLVSRLIDKSYLPESKANEFLCQQSVKNGVITEDDIETAATIYSAYKLKKAYKNIYKAKKKADELIKKSKIMELDSIDSDWFSAYEAHVANVADESILDLWAAILAGKVTRISTFRKIMMDRIALLDNNTIKAFTELCYRTFIIEVSTRDNYMNSYIPFYISDTEISEMAKFKESKLTEKEIENYLCDMPSESELKILEEIGLISMGEDFETTEFTNEKNMSFSININDQHITPFSIIQKDNEYYQTVWNGSIIFTTIGQELYSILGSTYSPKDYLLPVVKKYNIFMQLASELQRKNERNPFYRVKYGKKELKYL